MVPWPLGARGVATLLAMAARARHRRAVSLCLDALTLACHYVRVTVGCAACYRAKEAGGGAVRRLSPLHRERLSREH